MKNYLATLVILLGFFTHPSSSASSESLPLMPYPQSVELLGGTYTVTNTLRVTIHGMSDERRALAVKQLGLMLDKKDIELRSDYPLANTLGAATLAIEVNKGQPQTYVVPSLAVDESYQLSIKDTGIKVVATTDFGALHALASLSQLIADSTNTDSSAKPSSLQLPRLEIKDFPRFPWRGLMIDSVRHFLPVETIKRQLTGMAAAKLNVFHWHLTDDQGWRIESKQYPKLHELASDGQYYLQQEIRDIVAYAGLLGIRVVPEVDVPGHASAIAVAYPELMSAEKTYSMEDHWGVFEPLLDPSKPEVYTFVDRLVKELTTLFPDEYLHIGGDEVNPKQWQESQNVQAFMKENGLNDTSDLHAHFNQTIAHTLAKHQRKMMGWDEIFHPDLPKNIMIQSWRGMESLSKIATAGYQGLLSTGYYIDQPQPTSFHYRNDPLKQWDETIVRPEANDEIAAWTFTMPRLKGNAVKGSLVLIIRNNEVGHAYLKLNNNHYQKVNVNDHLKFENNVLNVSLDSWMGPLTGQFEFGTDQMLNGRMLIGNTHYSLTGRDDPDFNYAEELSVLPNVPTEAKENIIGGEATLWTEMVNHNNIDLRVWPRLFAIAERLWSSKEQVDVDDMYLRLEKMDHFASRIGLHHLSQQKEGFARPLKSNADLTPLMILSEQLEPASYYTRHHIKYQQNLYHQRAPLDLWVDFLPVESFQLIRLNRQLDAFANGDKQALTAIIDSHRRWQNNFQDLAILIEKNPSLSSIAPLVSDAKAINTLGLNLAQDCANDQMQSEQRAREFKQSLRKLHSQVREVSLASGLLVERMLALCH